MLPRLITNPPSDGAFRDAAETALEKLPPGNRTPAALAAALRGAYPRAAVRARDLAGEQTIIWYVYRDGRWTR